MSEVRLNRRYWRDRDAVHGLSVAALVVVATGGLLLVPYFAHALRVARRAPADVARARHLLVFGRKLRNGAPDAELVARVTRAHALLAADASRTVVLLGGRRDEGIAEADAAHAALTRLGIPADARIVLERESADTLENLRLARRDIGADAPVGLISSRYHLARCAMLARNLGFDAEPCAAEDRFSWRASTLAKLALEAMLLAWADIGTRWARLLNHRMLDRVT